MFNCIWQRMVDELQRAVRHLTLQYGVVHECEGDSRIVVAIIAEPGRYFTGAECCAD